MKILLILAVGLAIGCVGGMVGIGGGVLLIPALTQLFNMDPRKAAGISLCVLAVPVTLPGAWKYYSQGTVTSQDLAIAVYLAAAFAVGTFLGAHIQLHLSQTTLRLVFGLLLLYVAVRTLIYSSTESVHAAAGLFSVLLGWGGFLLLRALGRKHMPHPDLGAEIRRSAGSSPGTDEYYI